MVRLTHLSGFTLRRVALGTLIGMFAACSTVAAQQQSDNPPPQSSSPSAQTGHSDSSPQPVAPEKPAPPPKATDTQPKKDAKSDEPPESKLRVTVVAAETGKPIGNASVYIRFDEGKTFFTHKDKEAEMNFKTNQDGRVKVPAVPRGKVLVQIVAPGWHTYGKWYDIEKDEEEINIRLDKPTRWY